MKSRNYIKMSQFFEDSSCGNCRIEKFIIGDKDIMALIAGIPRGEYVRLMVSGEVAMSDTQMEKRTNEKFIRNAHGNILIAGLGIGMIVLPIQDCEDVESITIIEKNKDVIELVLKKIPLNSKVKIINADIFDFIPNQKFNTVYFDIWNYINTDVYSNEMKPLISKFRKYLVSKSDDSERYIDCWCKTEAKHGLRI